MGGSRWAGPKPPPGIDWRDLTRTGIGRARARGVDYADVRVVGRESESLQVKNGVVSSVGWRREEGCGVRVLHRGRWGFAASSDLGREEVEALVDEALAIARAGAAVKGGAAADLTPVPAVEDSYRSRYRVDPFTVKMEEKVELLMEANRLMRGAANLQVATSSMRAYRETRVFASTEGSLVTQEITGCGAGLQAVAAGKGEVQTRSYPCGSGGNLAQRGYESIEELELTGHAERVAREAEELLDAPLCPAGETTVILDGSQLALQVHESCGHAVELDRVLGQEASYAGTSFLTPDLLGRFRYGSTEVNLVADATLEGAVGSFAYDDEGVPASRVELVKEGTFTGYLTSRETAAALGQTSNGCMRAEGWDRQPLVRMTNINLEPGDWTREEIIKDTREGLYMETNRSWSIDDRRLNFQFGAEAAWEVVDGSLGRMYRNPTYTGITPEFWRSCDAVAGRKEWKLWGLANCAKGEPVQLMHVGHGVAPARFRRVGTGAGR